MPLHDTSYQHWEGRHRGVWVRRWCIARNGLTACLQNRWMRYLVMVCWMGALVVTALMFLVGQLLVADSVVVKWVSNLNPELQNFAKMLTSWLEEHPEVSVRTTQDVLFFYFGKLMLLPLSIFVLGMAIPLLITRDLASNAIIIYSSKAVSRGDYLLGKFSTAFGLMTLTWLGPICAAWFVGNLLAPDWRFFWHSRMALWHALVFAVGSLTVLSLIGLGVSAVSTKEKGTVAFWFTWWILGGVVVPIAHQTKPWLAHVSFNYNLDQMALGIFRLGEDLRLVQHSIPMFQGMLRGVPRHTMDAINSPPIWGALIGLLLMVGVAALMLRKKVRPE